MRLQTRTMMAGLMTLALIGFGGCERKEAGSAGAPTGTGASESGPIKVGVYASLTGSEATFGISSSNGAKMATEALNEAGGINGRKVELIVYDNKGNTQETGTVVTRLIESDNVVALLGETASGLSLAAGRIAQAKSIPMISHAATNPKVTEIGDMIHRICFTDDFQGYATASFTAKDLKSLRAAVLYDAALPYSVGLRDGFKDAYVKMGGTVTADQAYNSGDQDFSAQLTTIRATNPQVIFIPGYYTDVANIAIQTRRLGITVPLVGGDGWDSSQLTAIAGDAIEGSYYCNHAISDDPRPEMKAFVEKYKSQHGQRPDALAALGYDAANVLFESMKKSKSLAGADLAATISATKDFPGITGVITLDAKRNARKPGVIVQLKGGVPVFAASIDPPAN